MTLKMDTDLLRTSTPANLASHFLELLKKSPALEDQISIQLLSLAKAEALSPKVLSVWLSISKSPKTLLEALQQDFSISIRLIGIKNLAKSWRSEHWKELWDGIGGTAGFISLFAQFSVTQAKVFLYHMRRCIRGPDVEAKAESLTELLGCLLPGPDNETTDERPLINLSPSSWYAWLLPADRSPFQESELYQKNRLIWHARHRLLRQYCCDAKISYEASRSDLEPLLQYDAAANNSLSAYSESLAFYGELLRQLIQQPDLASGSSVSFFHSLIIPLLRRSWNAHKRIGPQQLKDAINLSLKYLEVHAEDTKQLNLNRKGLIYYAVISWANLPSERSFFEASLATIFQKVKPVDKKDFWSHFSSVLGWVNRPLKYDLLELILVHYGKWNLHLSLEQDLKDMGIGLWPQEVFFDMDRKHGLDLLQRQRKVEGDDILHWRRAGEHISARTADGEFGDITLLLGALGAPENAKAELKDRVAATGRLRDKNQRASSARSTLYCAIATGSLKLYGETLVWARRFLKDPPTSRDLFSGSCLETTEGLGLLSGIPEWPGESLQLGLPAIQNNIKEANKIILAVLDTVIMALKEPSFQRWNFGGALSLLSNVIRVRLDRSETLQKDLSLASDQLYVSVWEDTLAVAIQIETTCLQHGFEKISFGPMGPISSHGKVPKTSASKSPYLRFIDSLAKDRDTLWKGVRLSSTPEVATLPPSLPRGLALQHLFGNLYINDGLPDESFILARAKAAVFAESDLLTVVPDDEEIRSAVGPFVDDFVIALGLYRRSWRTIERMHQQSHQEQEDLAWNHALDKLSRPRMDELEAQRFWHAVYKKMGCSDMKEISTLSKTSMEYPLLPHNVTADDSLEWNPVDDFQPKAKIDSRRLSPTYLDVGLSSPLTELSLGDKCCVPSFAQTVGVSAPAIQMWNLDRIRSVRSIPAVWEGITLSALLYLDSKIKGPRSILTTSFPTPSEPRYPSLYLADEFLQLSDLSVHSAIYILKSPGFTNVPPTLLTSLTKSAFEALAKEAASSSDYANVEFMAFNLLVLVMRSDRPYLASQFIIDAILDRPDASSWHRQLMSKKFLNRLSPKHAEVLVRGFAEKLLAKMKEQSEARKLAPAAAKSSSDGSWPSSLPYVKITTVKLLAQLLDESTFISEDFAIEILTDLLQNATHIDIRVAVMYSMLKKLQQCPEEHPRGHNIISAFERLIPIAGSPDERQLITEEGWLEAERTNSPPKLYDDSFPPIFNAIAGVSDSGCYPDTWRILFTKQVVKPTIKLSISSHGRWMKIFAAKYGIKLSTLGVPILPIHPAILSRTRLTPSLLQLQHHYMITNLLPSQQLKEVNAILQDKETRKQPDVKHWLKLYSAEPLTTFFIAFDQHPAYLLSRWNSEKHLGANDIQLPQVSEYALTQAKILIEHHAESHKLEPFMSNFLNEKWFNYAGKQGKARTVGEAGPVIQQIISYVASIRESEAWQKDPHRYPAVLPQKTLEYQLWLLPYPAIPSKDLSLDQRQIALFSKSIAGAIEKLGRDVHEKGEPYPDSFSLIKLAALEVLPSMRANVACELYAIDTISIPLVRFLNTEVAQVLIQRAEMPAESDTIVKARNVVKDLQRSEIESVRMRGRELGKRSTYADKEWAEALLGREGDESEIFVKEM